MKSICETDYFSERALRLLGHARFAVSMLNSPKLLRCHELARVIGLFFELDVVDGRYGYVEHSWCTFVDDQANRDQSKRYILDPYAVGRLPQVQLIVTDMHAMIPTKKLYVPKEKRTDIDDALVGRLYTQLLGVPLLVDKSRPLPR